MEETSASLSEYLKAVKAIHEQGKHQWRALGKVRTNAGLAQLTEMDSGSEWGPIRILQLILIKDGSAYVLTAAALREEFAEYYQQIQSAFRSLTLRATFRKHPAAGKKGNLKRLPAAFNPRCQRDEIPGLFHRPSFPRSPLDSLSKECCRQLWRHGSLLASAFAQRHI